jgi:flagellar biosynthetic protein FliP
MRYASRILYVAVAAQGLAVAASATSEPSSLLGISSGKSGVSLSVPMQIILLLTLLTLLPAAVMAITPFLRITVVLHFLRQALGAQSAPSNQVLLGLALFLTIVIMQPVAAEMYHRGWEPMEAGQITPQQAMDRAAQPLRNFMIRFAREKDIRLLIEISHAPAPRTPADLDLRILIPAYILSELKSGFQIGAVLFLPFLVIDLVVASTTISVGMMQLPPAMISGPFKILLFVLVDGWNLVIGSLMKSFYQ